MMQNNSVSNRQAMSMLLLFLFGSTALIGVNGNIEQDSWISLLPAMAFAVPAALVYARIIRLFPEKDFFDILEMLFGKIFGKLITVLMVWYAIHLGALVLRNFSEFVQNVDLKETPQLAIMILMFIVSAYLARSGVTTLGKWSIAMLPVVILMVVFTILISVKDMKFDNLLPIFSHSPRAIVNDAFRLFSFPFAETVLFLSVAGSVKKKGSPYKIYLYAFLAGGVTLMAITLRNIETLGPAMMTAEYFPSYTTARIITVGNFLTRIEGAISTNFMLAGVAKIALCLMAAAKGTAKLFQIRDFRLIVLPVGLIALALAAILYKSTMEMFDFIKYYPIYAIPFQILIPILTMVFAEIYVRRKKRA